MSFKLQGGRVLIVPEMPTNKTAGGIIIPDTLKQERNVGIVAVIGESCPNKFEGRKVCFNRLPAEKFFYEGIDVLLLYHHDIIAILN